MSSNKAEKMDAFMNDRDDEVNKKETVPREMKRAPNRLMVEESHGDGDNSVVMMSEAKMNELGLFRGDTVLIKGKRKRETVCVAIMNEDTEDHKIRINKVVRKNLRAKLGDVVSVSPFSGALCMSGECACASGTANTHDMSTAFSRRNIFDFI